MPAKINSSMSAELGILLLLFYDFILNTLATIPHCTVYTLSVRGLCCFYVVIFLCWSQRQLYNTVRRHTSVIYNGFIHTDVIYPRMQSGQKSNCSVPE